MSNPPASSSPSRVTFASLTHRNLGTVKKLNSVLFPIKYSDKFYQDIIAPEVEDFCQLSPSYSCKRLQTSLTSLSLL
jgi:hypothetical protein